MVYREKDGLGSHFLFFCVGWILKLFNSHDHSREWGFTMRPLILFAVFLAGTREGMSPQTDGQCMNVVPLASLADRCS